MSVVLSCRLPDRKNEEGKRLAKLYCGSCHQVPSPDQLDKNTWLFGVLPKMGPRLGINSYQEFIYNVNRNSPGLPNGFYPDSAAISIGEWGKIVNYFYEEAPDSLHSTYPLISKKLDRFVIKTPSFPIEYPPVSCLVKIDQKNHAIYVAHGTQLKLKAFNQRLEQVDEVNTITVAVGLAFNEARD